MRIIICCISFICLFLNSFAQLRTEKPPKFPPKKHVKIEKTQPIPLPQLILNKRELKQNKDSLYCYCLNINDTCEVINARITIFSYSSFQNGDTYNTIPYTYAEGEFLKGKYNGIWIYYDTNKKIIKKEKWDNGKLIHRRVYK